VGEPHLRRNGWKAFQEQLSSPPPGAHTHVAPLVFEGDTYTRRTC
jgi:hypothetical protein